MDNALYYTVSTIAQALAAAAAILGAFVLYRVQLLGAEMQEAAATARTHSSTPAAVAIEITGAFVRGDYESVLSLTKANQGHSPATELEAAWVRLERAINSKKTLVRSFIVALLSSFLIVGGSVAILAFTPLIVQRSFPWVWLVVGVLAFIGALLSYARLLAQHVGA